MNWECFTLSLGFWLIDSNNSRKKSMSKRSRMYRRIDTEIPKSMDAKSPAKHLFYVLLHVPKKIILSTTSHHNQPPTATINQPPIKNHQQRPTKPQLNHQLWTHPPTSCIHVSYLQTLRWYLPFLFRSLVSVPRWVLRCIVPHRPRNRSWRRHNSDLGGWVCCNGMDVRNNGKSLTR